MSEKRSSFTRSSGVVMPIFSLPSPYGIGTMGKCAYEFIDKLADAGQTYWQILPTGHTGFGDSPYQCYSVVAGNPYFIDLNMLIEDELLSKEYLEASDPDFSFERIDYIRLQKVRMEILREAFKNADLETLCKVNTFVSENSDWIKDYAFFMALKKHFNEKPIWEWDDKKIVKREDASMSLYSILLKKDIEFYEFIQYLFFKQWDALKKYANSRGIKFIGDIPMYPSPDSVEVWVTPELFKLDENYKPAKQAGVPPDLYSETGQCWGNPVYDWNVHLQDDYQWWRQRIKYTLMIADVIRIDHFRAFDEYFEIPGDEDTAENGEWVKGPGIYFFKVIRSYLGDVPIIAEDLGIIGESVRELLAKTKFPGMGVMIFGFKEHEDNEHMPHNWKLNQVGYTSTHDSETICDAVYNAPNDDDRNFAFNYLNNSSTEHIGMKAIRSVWASPVCIAMTMMADILSLGEEGRINIPSTVGGNWSWRMKPSAFSDDLVSELRNLTKVYKRLNTNLKPLSNNK